MRSGSVAGSALNRRWISLRRTPPGEAVDHLDSLVGSIAALNDLLQDGLQVALRSLAILGEDEDSAVVPARWRSGGLGAERRQARAHVLADPVDEPARLHVRLMASFVGDRLHPVEQLLLPLPQLRL